MTYAAVNLWGRSIGAVSWDKEKNLANFEYTPAFLKSGIQVAPLMMPLSSHVYSFPAISRETFYGLPGMLADSLPDKFGNMLINKWLESEGRRVESFNPVERLCYIGERGIGALEYEPSQGPKVSGAHSLHVDALVALASEILTKQESFKTAFSESEKEQAMKDILRVGTSAGGARAKAIIAWNPKTNEVRSGNIDIAEGFSYWILKFDGVKGNKDKDLEDPEGYGLIEYAYHKMAAAAGIKMMECRILREGGRSHFMTKRFDRNEAGKKIHMQSLCALAHYDYNQAGAYSYEQAMQVMRKLQMPMESLEEQYRRTAFNIIARNQDDHVKNIAFLMGKAGNWALSPAFDVTYSYNPSGGWTNRHQMSVNAKRDDFVKEDFIMFAKNAALKKTNAMDILEEVQNTVKKWKNFADRCGVPKAIAQKIAKTHRTKIL
ncbi:MAG: type II toxin-antitoxin system HipA family toxin [Candidatus Omnitrophota bacterium]|nr:type II toxin-antitoxin system HipA family toxin [Candidatus Omnitrophota bacterium]